MDTLNKYQKLLNKKRTPTSRLFLSVEWHGARDKWTADVESEREEGDFKEFLVLSCVVGKESPEAAAAEAVAAALKNVDKAWAIPPSRRAVTEVEP